jgi:uncharacterized protein (DUF1778 family)
MAHAKRVYIYAYCEAEEKRRIKAMAKRARQSVTHYVLQAAMERVKRDEAAAKRESSY